jgi:hypothetical protein
MFNPFLLVGLGGSGGKTLRTTRDELQRRLDQAGWDGPFPLAWQFLHIDVPTHPDGNEPDLPPQLPSTSYSGLVRPGLNYKTLDDALLQKASSSQIAMDALAGWRPRAIDVNVPVDKGAGQYRALGRFITLSSLATVRESVEQSFSRLSSTTVAEELPRLATLFGDAQGTEKVAPIVVIVASIAGGSGAGMIMDVSDVIRSVGGAAGDRSFGLLYAPDVFDEIPAGQRKGVRPNALAALGEILNGYWAKDGLGAGDDALYEMSGVSVSTARRSGPHYPFIVGRRNSKVSFGGQNDVYRAVGRSLASWMTDQVIQDDLGAYTIANWESSSGKSSVADALPLNLSTQGTPFSAMGFARVGLGRDRFRQYSAEALARLAVDRLLNRHEELRQPGDDRPEAALVEELAEIEFSRFVKACKLDERTEAANDVLDAIRPPDFKVRMRTATEEALVAVQQGLDAANWGTWHSRIRQQLDARVMQTADELRNETLRLARAWVPEIQQQFIDEVAVAVSRTGLPTAIALLDRLAEEFKAVLVELPQEADRYRYWAQTATADAMGVGTDAGKSEIPSGHPDLRDAVERGYRQAEYLAEVELRTVAVSLLTDVLTLLVGPVRRELVAAHHQLRADAGSSGAYSGGVVQPWPVGSDVPTRLRPTLNEVLLVEADDYPAVLADLVRRTVGTEDVGSGRRAAVDQIVTGLFDDMNQSAVRTLTRWTPADTQLHTSASDARSKAAVSVDLGANDLLARADAWVSRTDTPVGRYMHETLANYLSASDQELPERSRRNQAFESGLASALDLADPLVDINASVMSVVHGKSDHATKRVLSGVPFPQGHAARDAVTRVLHSRGMDDGQIARVFVDDDREFVDIFTTLAEPYEAVVFDSLMRPIAQEWAMCNGTIDGRSNFWRWRRARPLPQALPLAAPVRKAMVRGWFTAQILGHLRRAEDSWEIFVPSGTTAPGTWMRFPNPLLMPGMIGTGPDALPAVLKSINIALVDVNSRSSLDPIKPYTRLRDLGSSREADAVEEYTRLAVELEAWLLRGKVAPGAPTPPAEHAGAAAGPAEERVALAGERWSNQSATYGKLFAEIDARENYFAAHQAWELRDDITTAFDDLKAAAVGGLVRDRDDDGF